MQTIVGVHEILQKQRDRNAELSHGSNKKCFSYLLCQWATIVYPNSARIWSTRELITANIRNRSLWIDWWVISGSQQQHVIGILDMYGGSGCVVPGISLFVVVDSFVRPFHQRRRQPWALDSNRMIFFPYLTSTKKSQALRTGSNCSFSFIHVFPCMTMDIRKCEQSMSYSGSDYILLIYKDCFHFVQTPALPSWWYRGFVTEEQSDIIRPPVFYCSSCVLINRDLQIRQLMSKLGL